MSGKPVMTFTIGVPEGCAAGDFVHNKEHVGIVCGEVGVLGFDRAGAELAARKLVEYTRGMLGGLIDIRTGGSPAADYKSGEGGTIIGSIGGAGAAKKRQKKKGAR